MQVFGPRQVDLSHYRNIATIADSETCDDKEDDFPSHISQSSSSITSSRPAVAAAAARPVGGPASTPNGSAMLQEKETSLLELANTFKKAHQPRNHGIAAIETLRRDDTINFPLRAKCNAERGGTVRVG